ncbi:MAG: YraN family protein [Deltaproteobacteria bacterium]|nr:YraN family protein [Deltaproteobacteria bacterium]
MLKRLFYRLGALLYTFFTGVKPPTQGERQSVGYIGETIATRYLKKQRHTIIKRNWKTLRGEIDIIAMEGNELVFVEVKTRINSAIARLRLFDTITERKKRKLKYLAKHFLSKHLYNQTLPSYRIDAIGIILSPDKKKVLHLKHIRRAV